MGDFYATSTEGHTQWMTTLNGLRAGDGSRLPTGSLACT
jgi:hypothetical protein